MIRALFAATLAAIALALPAKAAVEVQEITTPAGTEVWLVEERGLPFVAIELLFDGGTSLDAPGALGAVNLMTALIEEGAGEMDARAFSIAREALAARFRFRAGRDSLVVSAEMLTENRDAAADLLRTALTEPRFDADAIERVRGQVLSSIASDMQDPRALAGLRWNAEVFGDHPYGAPDDGTAESVAALTRDDLVAAHRGALARDRVHVAAVGDIGADDLAALVDRLLSGLPETGAPLPGPAGFHAPGGVTVVPYDTPQSVIVFGQEGIARDDPDFFPAFVMAEILGGSGFSARLMTEVRERRGLTYGIYADLAPFNHGAIISGQVATANETAAEVVALVREEWRRMADEGVTADELDAAQTFLTGAYPLRFDGNARIAGILAGMMSEGLPTSYLETRNDQVRAVTVDDIARVARRLLRPEDLVFVVAGQPEGLMAGN